MNKYGKTRAPDKRGIEDNSKITFLISQQKHMLWPLIRTVFARQFQCWVAGYVLKE